MTTTTTERSGARTRIELAMAIKRFHLPPVESAIAIGRRAGIGPKAMGKALEEMIPGAFTTVQLEHPIIEAIIVRSSHLRTVPEDKLIPLLVARCADLMLETDLLHFTLDVVVHANDELEV